jgi:6-phosphogluconolactonase
MVLLSGCTGGVPLWLQGDFMMFRVLRGIAVGIGLLGGLCTGVAGAESLRVYVGNYTSGPEAGIYLLDLDLAAGTLTSRWMVGAMETPSFLAVHPSLPVLYAVGESGGPEGGAVRAFAMEAGSGKLRALETQSSGGAGPCHVAVAPSGKHVAVANYSGGSVALFPVTEEGGLSAASAFVQHAGSSVNPQRQEGPHAHSVAFDPSGKFLLSADLGLDQVLVYRYDETAGTLSPHTPAFLALPPGAGPRHVAFHPSGKFLYVVNELDSTVSVCTYDAAAGLLSPVQQITTLPADFTGSNTTAEIRVHPSGHALYASNRGHDSLAVFAIDPAAGTLTALGHTPTGGKTPRNFNVDPTGAYVIAANQASDNVVLFRVDPKDGTLAPTGVEVRTPSPVCIAFVKP